MLRGLAIVVSALAFSAQPQGTKEVDATGAQSVPENAERPVLVASRTALPATAETRATGSTPTAKPVERQRSPLTAPLSSRCSMALSSRSIRYEAPCAAPAHGWTRAPFVATVVRCGRLYILQVKSW